MGLRTGIILLHFWIAAGCRSPQTEPAATPVPVATAASERQASANVRFLQRMIPHHVQALTMTALVPSRTTRQDVRRIAERIARSQTDEIAAMQRWLRARGELVPRADAQQSAAEHGHMPGMLTQGEIMQLEQASGAMFDRMFLEKMIRHHEGALVMVMELLESPGAQDAELYRMAADVDADQRAEINRMQTLLRTLP